MVHQLHLEVPDDIYQSLVETSQQTGQPLEDLAVEWLETAQKQLAEDPLDRFIGAFSTNIPDWADDHDKYLAGGRASPNDEAPDPERRG